MLIGTYIVLIVYAMVWLAAMLRNLGYRRAEKLVKDALGQPRSSSNDLPPLSIIIPAYDQCDALRHNLPHILTQEYPQLFEVIVVDMNSTDDTQMYLEYMTTRYPNLHVSHIPASARDVSQIRVALTLGMKAASHDWTVLTQADCHPISSNWLLHLGEACAHGRETNIVLGYTCFCNKKGWTALRGRFFHLWQQMLHLPYAARHGAYRADGTNLCYRRSFFLRHRGFATHANLLTGGTDIMVNQNSQRDNTVLCLHPDAFMAQDMPQRERWWQQERLFFMETRRHFRHGWLYRLKYLTHVCLTWLFTLATIGALTLSLLQENYVATITVAVLWALHAIFRAICFQSGARALASHITLGSLPLLLHLVLFWDVTAWLRWCFTRRKMFRKKAI